MSTTFPLQLLIVLQKRENSLIPLDYFGYENFSKNITKSLKKSGVNNLRQKIPFQLVFTLKL
ncbi:CLUMA_CG017402, isoform A [Clunio marinus]|uniref:CLUMA_CG017402, isoform A n=1 Tax=Clunio marinus TaxID=568069 RepID=A0A1J1IW23_9DIPT|nr:CLUMA_CG017402, isoform A [Clunio marinus]